MADTNYITSIQNLLQELQRITIMSMAETGVDKNSDLTKSVKWIITKDGIKMEVAEYYGYVSDGRKGTKRRAGLRKVPLDVLIQWIKKNNIRPYNGKTVNQLAFAIQNKIYLKGINSKKPVKGKGFAPLVADNVANYTSEELANVLANQIADELVDMFAPVAA